MLAASGKSQASGETPIETLQGYIRGLWIEKLKRIQGALPANGGIEIENYRVQLSVDMNILAEKSWEIVKEKIRDFIKGDT